MGKILKAAAGGAFALLLLISAAGADEFRDKSVRAGKNAVVGTWRMIYQTVRPDIRADSLFFAPYQIYRFDENGSVGNVASDKEISPEKALSMLEKTPAKTRYVFVSEGLMLIRRSARDADLIAVYVMIRDMDVPVRRNAPVLKKGDLVFSYLDPRKRLYMQRFFRKVK